MAKLSKDRCAEGFAFLCVCLMGISLFYRAGFTTGGDDEVYRTAIETWGSWREWATAYYNGWSGRIVLHSVLIALTNLPVIIWKIVSVFMVTATCCIICRTADLYTVGVKHAVLLIMTLILWRMIPNLYDPVRWAAGSVNYLYPVAALLVCLYLFYSVLSQKRISSAWKLCGTISCVMCANMEQSAAVLFAMGILFFVYVRMYCTKEIWIKRRKDVIYLLILWSINAGVMLCSYLAPGNLYRYEMEMFRCVGYGMLSYVDRVLLGMQRFILDLSSRKGFLLWMIPAGICAVFALIEKRTKEFAIVGIFIVLSGLQNIIVRKVLDIQFVHPFSTTYILWIVFTVFLLFYYGYIIIGCIDSHRDRLWFLFIYYGAITASVVSGLSPTLFVSAGRTVYISYVLLILVAIKCLRSKLDSSECKEKEPFSVEKLNAGLCAVITVILVGGFIAGNYGVEYTTIAGMEADRSLVGANAEIDMTNKMIMASVEVSRFEYDVGNWCIEEGRKVDINLGMGILNQDTGEIRLYKTCLNTQWPVMNSFPENRVEAVAYIWDGVDLLPDESYVIVATDHEGNTVYNALEITEMTE